jgi:hypothetical protein
MKKRGGGEEEEKWKMRDDVQETLLWMMKRRRKSPHGNNKLRIFDQRLFQPKGKLCKRGGRRKKAGDEADEYIGWKG